MERGDYRRVETEPVTREVLKNALRATVVGALEKNGNNLLICIGNELKNWKSNKNQLGIAAQELVEISLEIDTFLQEKLPRFKMEFTEHAIDMPVQKKKLHHRDLICAAIGNDARELLAPLTSRVAVLVDYLESGLSPDAKFPTEHPYYFIQSLFYDLKYLSSPQKVLDYFYDSGAAQMCAQLFEGATSKE